MVRLIANSYHLRLQKAWGLINLGQSLDVQKVIFRDRPKIESLKID